MALGTGAAMMGATLFGAMAADLSDYPSPLFIKDGVFDGLLVVGDNAAAEDIIGVTNIAMSLQSAAVVTKAVSTGATSVTVEGDAYKLGTTSNMLELGEAMNGVGITALGSNELDALTSGTFNNEKGDFTYNQDITLPVATVTFDKDSDQSDDPQLYANFAGSTTAYEYSLTFTPALHSDVDASNNMDDIKDKKITLFGKEYSILQASNTSTSVYLTLFSGAVTDIISEGATKTYTVEGKDYEVTASYIGSTEVMFTVNGEVSDKLVEGGTYRLADSTEIGVTSILAQNVAGEAQGDQVEFSLGAEKIKIEDTDALTDDWGATVTLGSTQVYQLGADISATFPTGDIKISKLRVRYQPSSALYVPVDGTLDASAEEEEAQTGNMFLNAFNIEFKGLNVGTTEEIKVYADDNYNYYIDFNNRNGDHYKVDIWGMNGASTPFQGKADFTGSSDRDLVMNESVGIDDEDYFILSPAASKKTHLMKFQSVNENTDIAKIKDLMDGGAVMEISYNGTFNLDGTTFDLRYDETTDKLFVDLDGDQTPLESNTVNKIYTEYSGDYGYIEITNATMGRFVTEKTQDKPSADYQQEGNWTFVYDSTQEKLGLVEGTVKGGNLASLQKLGGSDVYAGYDYWGTHYEVDYSDSYQPELKITYPDQQAEALVYVTSGATTTGAASSSAITTEEVQRIDVGAVKLASEVSDANANNLLLIGGPCANSVARTVMGVTSANCAEGFEAGKAMIKLYEHAAGKVAMVVAGAGAVDTRRAALVVANYVDYAADLVGDEVVVTTITSTPTVAQPVVEVEPEAEAEVEPEAEAEE